MDHTFRAGVVTGTGLAKVNWSAALVLRVIPSVVTVISTLPAASAGDVPPPCRFAEPAAGRTQPFLHQERPIRDLYIQTLSEFPRGGAIFQDVVSRR